jgi:predicted Co/Zn/Cd cation transporter (cation efflux family)
MSGEQMCMIALCDSQLIAASGELARFELGFLHQFIFFLLLASIHVHSLHSFHLNQIQD